MKSGSDNDRKRLIELLEEKIEEVFSRKKTPIIVGGSHFYIYSLFFKQKKFLNNKFNLNKKREEYEIKVYNDSPKGTFWCSCSDHKFNSSKRSLFGI